MGLSAFYASASTCSEDDAKLLFKQALSRGVTLINTACFYGPLNVEGYGANLRLLKTCLNQPGIDRSKLQLMCKIGMDTRAPMEKTGSQWTLRADEEGLKADVDYALSQLGVDYLDIIVLCRMPKDVSIEESTAAMAAIVKSGKARHIGLSEASPQYLRRAHAVHPVFCIEQEWSLWSRDIEENLVPTCRELGVKIVAYSPLGRGFLTGTIRSREDTEAFGQAKKDWRLSGQPKFADGAFEKNLALVDAAATKVAARLGVSMSQLALAWVHNQGDDVYPIPGTSKLAHLHSNLDAASISLSPADMEELNSIFTLSAPIGDRYPGRHNQFQNF